MWGKIADGTWLTQQRICAIGMISASVAALTILWLFATATGTLDWLGRPLGSDFSNVWSAGRMALDGHAAEAWLWPDHHAAQQRLHGDPAVPFYGWHYPPPFLMIAALLALLPYLTALLVWQITTLAAVVLLVSRVFPTRHTVLMTLSAPIVLICLLHGHNGFLTAALLGGGLFLLDRRPWLAGILFGCLLYKPQFAVLIPPLLLFGRHWRAFAGAAASASLLIVATIALWGISVWEAFFDSLSLTRKIVIEQGDTGWGKIQSPFAMIRMWGGDVAPAYAVQTITSILAVAAVLWIARRAAPELRNAAAMGAAMLSTPYVLDYDYVVLGVGCVFLLADCRRRGFLSYERSLAALIWAAPLFARQAGTFALLPLGQMTAVILLLLAVRRAVLLDDAAAPLRASPFRRSREASGQ